MPTLKARTPSSTVPTLGDAHVIAVVAGEHFLLSNGRTARCAASCLLAPETGDRVLVGATGDGLFVLHVLEREGAKDARVRVPGASEFAIEQESIALLARRRMALLSLGDVEVSAAGGSLALNGRNLFVTAVDSLVENARHRIAQVNDYLLQVKDLWRVHSRHGLVTADGDLKVDAERVSVG